MTDNGQPKPPLTHEQRRDAVLNRSHQFLSNVLPQLQAAVQGGDESPIEMQPHTARDLFIAMLACTNVCKELLVRQDEMARLLMTDEQRATWGANAESRLGLRSVLLPE